MRLFLLGSVVLALATVSTATSFDYANKGSIGAGTAILTGSAQAGESFTLMSPLVSANSVSATGTVTITTGTLIATSNPSVFNFTGGTITVQSAGNTLFQGTFSSATVTVLGDLSFSINGTLNNGAVMLTEMDKHGDVDGSTWVVTPEPPTLALLGTGVGLIGMAVFVRRKSLGDYRLWKHMRNRRESFAVTRLNT